MDAVTLLCDLLSERYGLEFPDRRVDIVTARLRERAGGPENWDEYVARLEHPAGEVELSRLLDQVTVHTTQFFRNRPLFGALRDRVMPELAATARSDRRPVRLWSAGCSTGEEAYSLAMLALEAMPG